MEPDRCSGYSCLANPESSLPCHTCDPLPFLMAMSWAEGIRAVMLDISGVLKDSANGGDIAIPGSVEAVERLKAAGLPVRFCTNETTITRRKLVDRLQKLGFHIKEEEVFSPAPAVCQILRQRGLRPHLLVHPDSEPDFDGVEKTQTNCVVIGDAGESFSYENMNRAFQKLIAMDKPVLISMGKGKFYKDSSTLILDVGAYMKALEYACDVTAEVVGKPSASFFLAVLQDLGALPEQTLMVGDDIENDVGGAQCCGMRAALVRTGKYRATDENHQRVKPDAIMDNLSQVVDVLLGSDGKL